MRISRQSIALAPLLLAALACNRATFSGNNASRGTHSEPPGPLSLSCSVEPSTINVGDKALITITNASDDQALYQRVKKGDSVGDFVLAKDGDSYRLEGDGANEIAGVAAGTITVELRRDQAVEGADATCELVVTETTTPPVEPKPCKPEEQSIGAELALLIDNSNSNAATDCPLAKKTGTFNGVDTFTCGEKTGREAAVEAAFEALKGIAEGEPNNSLAGSRLAIAAFPTAEDYVEGWSIRQEFLETTHEHRDAFKDAMLFTRQPSGLTPYGAAFSAATKIFESARTDKRARVAVLVTDGEPTDRDPSQVEKLAADLREQGVQLITIFVTGQEQRATRIAAHTDMLRAIDEATFAKSRKHWYSPNYADFNAYIETIVGGASQAGLVAQVTSPQDPSCVDAVGAVCPRNVVEVQNAQGLKDAFLQIIKTQAIGCER